MTVLFADNQAVINSEEHLLHKIAQYYNLKILATKSRGKYVIGSQIILENTPFEQV